MRKFLKIYFSINVVLYGAIAFAQMTIVFTLWPEHSRNIFAYVGIVCGAIFALMGCQNK